MRSSKLYFENHKLLEREMMEDGFFDPGRRGDGGSKLPNLDALRGAALSPGGREVILLDGQDDEALVDFLEVTVTGALQPLTDVRARAKRLAELVGERLGGDRPDIVEASEAEIARRGERVLPIGELKLGVCRHRSLLFK